MNIDSFVTPLGTVELDIDFKNQLEYDKHQRGSSKHIQTTSFSIEIISFNNFSLWSEYFRYEVERFYGWIILIIKEKDIIEQIEIACQLKTSNPDIRTSQDGGENLDAVLMENKTHFLSIGTEDGESLKWRSNSNDYMPSRFEKELGYQSEKVSFTEYLDFGFKTIVPELRLGEKLYFHYLMATNPKPTIETHPDFYENTTTHYAVSITKDALVNKLKIF